MPKEKKQKEPKPKKPIFKRWWFWVIVVLVVCFIAIPTDSNNSNSQPSAAPTATPTAAKEKTPEPTAEPTTEPTPEPTPKPTLTPAPTPKPTPEVTPEPIRDKEWLSHVTPKDLKTYTGEILDVTFNGTDLIVKQKIKSQSSNKLTIDQNYYNACEIIRSLGGAEIRDLQYWAVADMRDGSESKVISFTVPEDTVKTIQTQKFPDNTLSNYVKDLWILPSLQN